MNIRKRIGVLLAGVGLVAGIALAAPPSASATAEQYETSYYCSAAVAVPGTYGTFTHCVTYSISQNSAGTTVETPGHCRVINNTGKTLNWYREAWTHWDGYIFKQVAYGNIPTGTTTKYCGQDLLFWRVLNEGSFVRASVQAAGSNQTAGASVPAP